MRKNIIVLSSILLLGACNLNLAPENVLVDQTVYSNPKTAQAALMGAYVRMAVFLAGAPEDQNNYSYPSFCWMAGDLGTYNLKARDGGYSSYTALEEGIYDHSVRDGDILSCWLKGYNAIDYANNVIDGIQRYGDMNDPVNRELVAEARFLRAFVYFNLQKMFGDGALTGKGEGLGLILRDKPYDGYNPDQIQTRASVSETWRFIINDLAEAAEFLPGNPGAPESRFRASAPVVNALLSRVYLYMGSYVNDRECMTRVIDISRALLMTGDYSFNTHVSALREIFPLNAYDKSLSSSYPDPTSRSPEIIFYQPSRISTELFPNGISSPYFTKKMLLVEPGWVAGTYASGDHRGILEGSVAGLVGTGSTNHYPSDLTSLKYSNNDGYDDVVFFRLAEVKLNLAEALARRDGITEEALGHLNDVRCRPFLEEDKPVALSMSDFSSTESFIDEILEERNRELAFESHRRWDLIRSGKAIRNESLSDGMKILPIPDYEVNISKGKIQQNSAFR
ncbi:MAG: RagB/SusD family nutrient uptake outer membrane protein [Bacteroidales bacterium]|nr:RagB/SusD family nutrient uptake outer membrane protein [Bacteroidales bacterium]